MRKFFVSVAVAVFLVTAAQTANAALFTYSGDTTGALTFDRPICDGAIPPACSASSVTVDVRYHVFGFTVDLSGEYTMVNVGGTLGDPVFVLYRDSFSPVSPLVNVYAYNDDQDNPLSLRPRINAPLEVGTQYFLVTTGFVSDFYGTFTNEIRGDGNIIPGAVPEPTSLALLGSALAGVLLRRARRRR